MKTLILFCLVALVNFCFGQNIINGNFEIHSATYDIINMSNSESNSKLRDIYSFGSYGDVDIIKSTTYGGGGAQDGTWYLAITGGGTDIIAMTLSQPLVQGKKYTLSFYDRKDNSYPASPVQIGLSTNNNSFGTVIYTAPEGATLNKWTERVFTFVAPNNGQYITVQMTQGGIQEWVNIDNFSFKNPKCEQTIQVLASATEIELGGSATFTVTGSSNYKWVSANTLSSSTESVVTANPQTTTVYTVTSHQKGCEVLTATVALTVTKPIETDTAEVITKTDTVKTKQIIDTPIVAQHKAPFKKRRFKGRKLEVQETLNVYNHNLKILVWDKNKVDGDEVAIYLNGELIEEKIKVTKTKKEITLFLEPGRNVIIMHALNLGSVPPNTAILSVNDGLKAKLVTVVSDMKKSGVIEVNYEVEGLGVK